MTWHERTRGCAHLPCSLRAHQPLAAGPWRAIRSDQSSASVYSLFLSPAWPSLLPPRPHRSSELFHPQIPNSGTPGAESPTLPGASCLLRLPRSSSSWKDPCPPDPSTSLCPRAPLSCPMPFWTDPQEGARWRRALGLGGSQPAPRQGGAEGAPARLLLPPLGPRPARSCRQGVLGCSTHSVHSEGTTWWEEGGGGSGGEESSPRSCEPTTCCSGESLPWASISFTPSIPGPGSLTPPALRDKWLRLTPLGLEVDDFPAGC